MTRLSASSSDAAVPPRCAVAEPAQPTADCPHQYGYYALGDAANCGKFMNCAAGRGYVFDCPDGLAFNPKTLHCDWPDQVETCDAEGKGNFRPPTVSPARPAYTVSAPRLSTGALGARYPWR